MAPVAVMLNLRADALTAAYSGDNQRGRPTTGSKAAHCLSPTGATTVQLTQSATIGDGTSCAEPHGPINCPADIVPSYR